MSFISIYLIFILRKWQQSRRLSFASANNSLSQLESAANTSHISCWDDVHSWSCYSLWRRSQAFGNTKLPHISYSYVTSNWVRKKMDGDWYEHFMEQSIYYILGFFYWLIIVILFLCMYSVSKYNVWFVIIVFLRNMNILMALNTLVSILILR